MTRPTPTPRQQPGRVAMQVARDGGGPEVAGGTVPTRGRHRTPDTGAVPASGPVADGEGAPQAAAPPSVPRRHGVTARQAELVARRTAPGSLERVEAAQAAASRPAAAPETADEDDAVTDLVAGPTRRGRAAVPEGPGTGPVPGVLGLVLGVLALVGAVVAAAVPAVVGRLGASPLALAGLVALGLLATACAGLGTGRARRGRGVAVTGMVVGLAAVAAAVVPLVALASL